MATKVDAVLLALLAKWQALPALSTVEVVDGPQANSDATTQWLFVGSDGAPPFEGMQVANATQEWQAFARVKKETAELTCAFVLVSGDRDTVSIRQLAFSYLAAAEDALRADDTLAGLVLTAGVSGHQYYPAITTAGPKVRLVFTVNYLAQL